jgi:predicted house-cleaning NTP pyrophosphatase (Maf/HAM1 superfamily)
MALVIKVLGMHARSAIRNDILATIQIASHTCGMGHDEEENVHGLSHVRLDAQKARNVNATARYFFLPVMHN